MSIRKQYNYIVRFVAGLLGIGSIAISILLFSAWLLGEDVPYWFLAVPIPLLAMAYVLLEAAWRGEDPKWLYELFDVPKE